MAIALVLVLVVAGSVLFHALSPWWWTPIASNWGYIDQTLIITFWITGACFCRRRAFHGLLRLRFRHKEGQKAHYEPESKRLEMVADRRDRQSAWRRCWLRACSSGTSSSPSLTMRPKSRSSPSNGSGASGCPVRTESSARRTAGWSAPENPLGINPEDPNGQDDVVVEAADLHLPMGKPVKVLLRSIDVLHDFYVPEFRAKMDMIPGSVTYFWFTPTRTGTFEVLCAELCGVGHGFMRGIVMVDTAEDYQAWLQEQSTFAQLIGARESGRGGADPARTWRQRQGRRFRVMRLEPHRAAIGEARR